MTNDLNLLGNCPDAAEMAALVDGRLSDERRGQVQSHISACDECFEVFADVNHALADAPEVVVAPAGARNVLAWRPRVLARPAVRRALVGLAAAAAVVLAVVSPRWLARPASDSPELRELVAAAPGQRPVEGRLSGGFRWAPVSAMRSAAATEAAPDVRIAVAQLEKAVRASRTPANLGAYAVARLFVGELDGAIRNLEEATVLDTQNAHLWSDLSASYLARGQGQDSKVDLGGALDAAERAAQLDPTLLEPLFNRALAREELGLKASAIEAWKQYLAKDSVSKWATEAQHHLNGLNATLPVSQGPQKQRERLFDSLLPVWAEAEKTHDDAGASGALAGAQELANQLAALPGDRLPGDAVEAVRRALASGGTVLRAIVNGHRAYGAARKWYNDSRYDRAGPEFDTASRDLEVGGSPLALAARYYAATTASKLEDWGAARARLEDLSSETALSAYPSLTGRIALMLGRIDYRSGAYERALQRYQSAAQTFRASQDSAIIAYTETALAEAYDRLGRADLAWNHRIAALLAGSQETNLRLSAAIGARQMGWLHVAAALQDAGIELARASKQPENVIDALRNRAITDCALGEPVRGRARLDEAKSLIEQGSESAWERLGAEIDLATVLCVDTGDVIEAIAAASRAARYFSTAGDRARLTEVLSARGHAERLAAQVDAARGDLLKALALMDTERVALAPGVTRAEFAERARRASDELVLLEMAAGHHDDALRAAERIRGWDLKTASTAALSSTGVSEIQAAIDAHTTVAYYVVCPRESYVWIVRQGRPALVEVILAGAAELDTLTRSALDGEPQDDMPAAVERLFIDPVVRHAGAEDLLVVIPDGALHRVAFPAVKTASGRRLIEDHPLLLAPSAAEFVEASRVASEFVGAPRTVLSVGNPAIDIQRYPSLPDLRWAEDEARDVKGAYSADSVLLIGRDATERAVRRSLPNVDVAHFAVHAIMDESDPERGELVLSPSGGDRLTGRVVPTLSSPRLRLVVLAACRTLSGRPTGSQGPLGLARGFIQAGVPDVIASPWDLDDRATRQLLATFHREFVRSGDAARALRTAQIEMLNSGDPALSRPSRWAGLVVVGGQRRIVAND